MWVVVQHLASGMVVLFELIQMPLVSIEPQMVLTDAIGEYKLQMVLTDAIGEYRTPNGTH